MSSNVYPSRSAERTIFREDFRNAYDLARNGGVLTGAPVVKDGVILDGATQYVQYAIAPTLLTREEISFECKFTPAFAVADGLGHYWWDTNASGNSCLALKRTTDDFQFYIGGTLVVTATAVNLAAAWNEYAENTLIVSTTSGGTTAWLNGMVLATSVTAWTIKNPTVLRIGASIGAASKFAGTIHHLKISATLLTQADVDAIESGRLWTYPNRASVWLDMKEATARVYREGEELINGDFTAWTPNGAYEDPDDWNTTNPATATSHVEEAPSGSLHVVSDGAFVALSQTTLVVGLTYCMTFEVSAVVSGTGNVVNGAALIQAFSTPGTYEVYFVANHTNLTIKRLGACDFTVDSISVKPILARTLDKSPNGHVCLLGDGSTANTIPDFLNPGFGLDGANQYMEIPQAGGILGHAAQTIAVVFRPDFNWDANTYYYLFDSTAGARYYVLKRINADGNTLQFLLGNTSVENLPSAAYSAYWRTGGLNVLVFSGISGNVNAWLNGAQIITSDTTAWTPMDVSSIVIGAANNKTSPFDGKKHGFYSWPEALSPLQVRDFTLSRGVLV